MIPKLFEIIGFEENFLTKEYFKKEYPNLLSNNIIFLKEFFQYKESKEKLEVL